MRKTSIFSGLLAIALLFTLASCQKEISFQDDLQTPPGGGPITTDILGDWTFIGFEGKTNTSVMVTESGITLKLVALADYVTIDNVGTLKVTNDKFFFNGIGYTVDDEVIQQTYMGGVLIDQTEEPFDFVNPPADNETEYTRNNNDSITFVNLTAMLPDPTGTGSLPTPQEPIGARINVTAGILTVKVKTVLRFTIPYSGIPTELVADVESVMKFRR